MKILKILGAIFVLLLALFFVVGMILPNQWETSYSAEIHASPEKIYPEVAKLKNWQRWSPWKDAELDMTSTYSGPEEGVGARWDWTSKDMGTGYLEVIEADPAKGIRYNLFIDMNGHQNSLLGQMAFQAAQNGTLVTWTDKGDAGGQIIRKWMALMMGVMVKRSMKQGLSQLDSLLN